MISILWAQYSALQLTLARFHLLQSSQITSMCRAYKQHSHMLAKSPIFSSGLHLFPS